MKTIIKSTAVMAAFLFANNSFAQPSDTEVKNRALRNGANKVEFYGTGGVTTTLTETYYIRSFEATYDTEYEGVTQVISQEYKYVKSGGSWSFARAFSIESLYEGIPNPSFEDLMVMINADMKEFLGGSYTDVVGDIESIKIAEDPNWKWYELTSVSVDLEAVYSKKMSSTTLSKVKQIHTVRLYSNEFKGPWMSMLGTKKGYPQTLSSQEYSSEELSNMKTIYDIQLDKEAEALMSALPAITIPEFTNSKEVIVYTFKLLREASYDEFKAYMYQMLSERYFFDDSKVLNSDGDRIFEDMEQIFNSRTAFKDQYCENPKVKTDGETSMEFWNRDKSRFSRIVAHPTKNGFEVRTISAYVFVKDEDIANVKSAGDSNCGEKINTEPEVIATYKIGDKVSFKSRGAWYNGTINKADPNIDGRYYITSTETSSAWINAEDIKASSGSTNTSTTEQNKSDNSGNTGSTTTTNTETNNSGSTNTEENSSGEEKKDKKKIKIDPNKAKGVKKKIKIGG